MPLSTLRFVREAIRQQRRWHRLRDWLLLALRTLAVLLLALALARPQWGQRLQISDLEGSDAVRVVLLDVSQSMAAREGAVEQIERARTVAARYLRYRPGLAANLILAGARPQGVFDGPSTNFDALRDELAHCPRPAPANGRQPGVGPGRPHVGARLASAIVAGGNWWWSAIFSAPSWAKADFSPLPADTQIQLESTAPAQPPANLAILRVEGRAAGPQGSTQLDVDVGNYSPTARKITVEVAIGDSSWRLTGTCPPGAPHHAQRGDRRRPPGLASGRGAAGGRRRRPGRRQRLPLRAARPAAADLCLDDPPGGGRKATSSLFLECALAPTARNNRQPGEHASAGGAARLPGGCAPCPRIVRMDPAALDQAVAAAGDLIVLDHPGKLADETVKLLAALLRRGRPILYVAAELIDATNLKRLGEAAGSGLQMPVEFAPPPAGQVRRDLFFTVDAARQPAVRRLRRQPGGGDGPAAFCRRAEFPPAGYGRGRRRAGRLQRRLGRHRALLVRRRRAGGDQRRSGGVEPAQDLGLRAVLAELVEQMLDRHRAARRRFAASRWWRHLPRRGRRGGRPANPRAGRRRRRGRRRPLRRTGRRGRGRGLAVGDARGRRASIASSATACPSSPWPSTIPPEESRLEVLPPEVLTSRLAAGRTAVYHGAADEGRRRDDFWKWFAVACVVCILGETSALLCFRT